jgi:polyhydroxybutyrate depolymerase
MIEKSTPHSLAVLLVLGFLTVFAAPAAAETFYNSIGSGGRERTFVVSTPAGAKRGQRLPTVIALHGGLMQGRSLQKIFGMDELTDKGRFAVVYPDGLKRRWNDGRAIDQSGPDDVRFIRRLAEHLVESGLADPRRLYLLGVSNGGMLTYRIACEAPGIFTAYAAVIANMSALVAENCKPGHAAPIIVINSTDDRMMPYDGGEVGHFRNRGEVLSTEETIDFWRRHNGCSEQSQMKPLPDKDRDDDSTVNARQYSDCRSGSAVVLLTVEGGGHVPPGAQIEGRPFLQRILGGKGNQDISAADVSWKFFKRFPL